MRRLLVTFLITSTSLTCALATAFYRRAWRPLVNHPPFDLEAEVSSWWAVDVVDG